MSQVILDLQLACETTRAFRMKLSFNAGWTALFRSFRKRRKSQSVWWMRPKATTLI